MATVIKLSEFDQSEKKDFEFNRFKERGVEITFMIPRVMNKPQSGNLYKFGVVYNNELYWFFYGQVVKKDRKEAIKLYKELKKYCNYCKLEDPFMFKEQLD